jgi:hypothetical protein
MIWGETKDEYTIIIISMTFIREKARERKKKNKKKKRTNQTKKKTVKGVSECRHTRRLSVYISQSFSQTG